MNGGRFDYVDSRLKDEIFGWTDKPNNVFEDWEISELVWDVLNLIHEFDWYASGDTRKETYLKAKAEFKKKWLDNRGVRVRRIVDEALKQCRDELYGTFGLVVAENAMTTATDSKTETVRCADCKHLMLSDCYGECSAAYRGIVRPDDTCPHGERRGDNEQHH